MAAAGRPIPAAPVQPMTGRRAAFARVGFKALPAASRMGGMCGRNAVTDRRGRDIFGHHVDERRLREALLPRISPHRRDR